MEFRRVLFRSGVPRLPPEPDNAKKVTTAMIMVPISTVNITGFFSIVTGFNFTNDCLTAVITISFSNNFMFFFLLDIQKPHNIKCSAIGPNERAGKKEREHKVI